MPRVVYENESAAFAPADRTFLAEQLGGHFERRPDGWAVCRVVGHVALPSGQVISIRSRKAPAAAIFAWLAFVDPALRNLRFLGRSEHASEEGELTTILARTFLHHLLEAFHRHGLNRRYRRVHVQTGTVRGAIDFPRIVRQGGELSRMPCRAWERLPQTPLNQTLAAALHRIRGDHVLRTACRHDLPAATSAFANVAPRPHAGLLSQRTPLARDERHFDALLALARLVLAATGLNEGVSAAGAAFILNLETLFEQTVALALQELGGHAKVGVPYSVHTQQGSVGHKSMEMDVFLPEAPAGPLVVDAKYKTAVASANLQQMVTYCFVAGARRAVLVFPKGFVAPGHVFHFSRGNPEDPTVPHIEVHTAELETNGLSVDEWRAAAKALATAIVPQPSRELGRESVDRVLEKAGTLMGRKPGERPVA